MRIAVIPRSGYANRLQAIASTIALAHRLGASLQVCWIPEAVAPATADEVLDPGWARAHAVDADAFTREWGLDPLGFPPYLGSHGGHLTLAGFDRGEQVFMADLASRLPAHSLVIRAGGHFSLDRDEERGREERAAAYATLPLHPEVEARAAALADAHAPYVGVHIRLGDRSRESASPRRLVTAAAALAARAGTTRVFVASDSAEGARQAGERLRSGGLTPWDAAPASRERASAASCHPALVDWRLLTRARAIAYAAASSFGEEATVAGRTWAESEALAPTGTRRLAMASREVLTSALTYPRRHGWGGRSADGQPVAEGGAERAQ